MAWIESHQTLSQHPKTRKLAILLGVSKPAAIGHLHCLWWWAIDYAEEGNLNHLDSLDIAIGAEWEGDADTFVDALTRSGFLDLTDDGLAIHDWDDYAGKLIGRRKANAERMRAARASGEQDTTGAHAGTESERAAHVQRTQRARAERQNSTVPNPTEQNPTGQTKPGGDAPESAKPAPDVPLAAPRPPKSSDKRGTRLDDSFTLTSPMRSWAVKEGLPAAEVDRETDKFRDYWAAQPGQKGVKLDWQGTWRNWIRRAVEDRGPRGSGKITHLAAPAGRSGNGYVNGFDEVIAEYEGRPPSPRHTDDDDVIDTHGRLVS